MKNKNHLPMIGVGPVIVIPQLLVTALLIILSENGVIENCNIALLKIPFTIIGFCLIIFGVWLWYSANFINKIDKKIKTNELETTGVYGIVRNPIYSAFFLLCCGAIFIENNLILFVIPIINWIYMTILLKHTEEKWLYKLYGKKYEEYCKKVNRCIPYFIKR